MPSSEFIYLCLCAWRHDTDSHPVRQSPRSVALLLLLLLLLLLVVHFLLAAPAARGLLDNVDPVEMLADLPHGGGRLGLAREAGRPGRRPGARPPDALWLVRL